MYARGMWLGLLELGFRVWGFLGFCQVCGFCDYKLPKGLVICELTRVMSSLGL